MKGTFDNTKLVNQFFPADDAITRSEYHRQGLPLPVVEPRVLPTIDCEACGEPFRPDRKTSRFCSTPCRRWFHYGPGAASRKGAAA